MRMPDCLSRARVSCPVQPVQHSCPVHRLSSPSPVKLTAVDIVDRRLKTNLRKQLYLLYKYMYDCNCCVKYKYN
ncbi:unnamed protein product [Tenebrio molitor]|nr:unnamed protein product [Tenebrio molitor]